ncbi:MAG: penicillin acylase family protein, partial [Candidatus Binatia bacterium]
MATPRSRFLTVAVSALLRPVIRFLDKPSLPRHYGSLPLAGLTDNVKVYWTSYGIPHVYATNEEDLFLAQGYLHAQERLWQMDLSRRFLCGRLAETFGTFSLPWRELSTQFRDRNGAEFDYFMRLLGIRHAAVASLDLLSEQEHRRLQAYSRGVNLYIERGGKKLPWEFRLLRYQPEPWQPVDSLTIGKGLAFLLSTALFTRLNMIAIAAKLEDRPALFRSLCPSYSGEDPTITRTLWDSVQNLWQFTNGAFARSHVTPAGHGSNSWVLAPSRSTSGKPILCNDPHLRLTVPSMWYLMHLKTEPPDGYEAWGASIPGSPCVQLGHNRWIAWGVTAAVCDDVEIYREKIHPIDPDRYLIGNDWVAMGKREEIIRIRRGRDIRRTVRCTRHGPVLSDFGSQRDTTEILSLRWTAHEPSQEFRCLYGVNQARDWHQFLDSLAYQSAPTLNYVYADCQGNIGYSLAGKIPLRSKVPSLLPVNGWIEDNHWRGYISFNQLPRIYNPPEGVIATANNRIVDDDYPHYFSHFFEPSYRIRRIKALLTTKEAHSISDMEAIQSDLVSVHAREFIEILRNDLDSLPEEITPAADRLLRWDGHCAEDSVAAAIFHVFHHRLMFNLLVPVLGEDLFLAYVEIFNQSLAPTDQILKDPESPWFAVNSRKRLIITSLREARAELTMQFGDDLELWQWGKIHNLALTHSLGRSKWLRP